jgi:glycosyltransferase involved in cell wall biosynthesis
VKVIGDWAGADAAYRSQVQQRIDALGLAAAFEFCGMVSDDERDRLLARSHILAAPSYHEGFCVPVIEALRAGLLPVVYFAHNLRYIADGLCMSSAPGDIDGFARALARAIDDAAAVQSGGGGALLHVDRATLGVEAFEQAVSAHLEQFEPASVAAGLRLLVRSLAAV